MVEQVLEAVAVGPHQLSLMVSTSFFAVSSAFSRLLCTPGKLWLSLFPCIELQFDPSFSSVAVEVEMTDRR